MIIIPETLSRRVAFSQESEVSGKEGIHYYSSPPDEQKKGHRHQLNLFQEHHNKLLLDTSRNKTKKVNLIKKTVNQEMEETIILFLQQVMEKELRCMTLWAFNLPYKSGSWKT